MNVFLKILGVLLIVGGIVGGIWIVILLVGGIKQIVAGLSTTPMDGSSIAWGVVDLVIMGVSGFVALMMISGGIGLITAEQSYMPRKRRN